MMLAAFLMLLGSMSCLSSVHREGELKALELEYGDTTGIKLDPLVENFGSHKYYIPGLTAKWTDAVIYCAKVGGILTDIRSPEELNFLRKLSEKTSSKVGPWVGAAAVGPNSSFVWISDPKENRPKFWLKDEPKANNGNCVTFIWWLATRGLQVHQCREGNRRFICKLPVY